MPENHSTGGPTSNRNVRTPCGPCTRAFWPARGSVNELAFLVSDQLNKGTFFSIHKGVNHEVVRPEGGKSTNWRARPVRVAIDPSSAAIASSPCHRRRVVTRRRYHYA